MDDPAGGAIMLPVSIEPDPVPSCALALALGGTADEPSWAADPIRLEGETAFEPIEPVPEPRATAPATPAPAPPLMMITGLTTIVGVRTQ